jgi:hypothetical protein
MWRKASWASALHMHGAVCAEPVGQVSYICMAPCVQSQMDKWIRSSISELDVSTWDRATPSYVLLPANYPKLK